MKHRRFVFLTVTVLLAQFSLVPAKAAPERTKSITYLRTWDAFSAYVRASANLSESSRKIALKNIDDALSGFRDWQDFCKWGDKIALHKVLNRGRLAMKNSVPFGGDLISVMAAESFDAAHVLINSGRCREFKDHYQWAEDMKQLKKDLQ